MTPRELREWRERWFLDQDELAALLEVHAQTIRNWEHGRTRIPHMAVLALEALAGEREKLRGHLVKRQAEIKRRRRDKIERIQALRDKRIASVAL